MKPPWHGAGRSRRCETASVAVEQGLSVTVIEAPNPLEGEYLEAVPPYDARKEFYSARRIWLGESVAGIDWLHEAIEAEFGEDRFWYDVQSRRSATHVGAAGETAAVVVILMGVAAIEFVRRFAGRLGDRSA